MNILSVVDNKDNTILVNDLSNKYIEAYKTANKKLGLKEQITIECDSMKFLKNNTLEDYIKDEKISLILIDPPYGDMLCRERTGENLKNKKAFKKS